jgi:hypothetical protein
MSVAELDDRQHRVTSFVPLGDNIAFAAFTMETIKPFLASKEYSFEDEDLEKIHTA